MKTVKYVPKACKGDSPVFTGEVELRLPTFDEKFDLLDAAGVEIGDDGKVELSGSKRIKIIRQLVRLTKDYYVAVSLKRLDDESELKSYDDLQCDSDAHEILGEVALEIMHGFKLGKK